MEHQHPAEDKPTKVVEYDDKVITSNPKVITLIDKLKQLSMMTKPKEPHIANLTVSAKDLKVVISVNEYIEEMKSNFNNSLKNDFR